MALDATVGGPASNSYLTRNEAIAYFETRLHSAAWTALTDDQKDASLIWATRLIDTSLCFTGSAATSTQALAWPRTGMTSRNGFAIANNVIPQDLKNVVAEMALRTASADPTATSEAEAAGLSELKAGPVTLKFADFSELESVTVPDQVRAMLPPSWLCPVEDPSKRTIIFEAL